MEHCFNFTYTVNGIKNTSSTCNNKDFDVLADVTESSVELAIDAKNEVTFDNFEISFNYKFNSSQKIFVNGYQSWTVSREYSPNEKMDEFNPRFMGIEKRKLNPLGIWGAGDLLFHKYPEKHGIFYGYSYGYVRNGDELILIGSLCENEGYTIITFDVAKEKITIQKDLEGVVFTPGNKRTVLKLILLEGSYETVFDEYFEAMHIAKPRVKRSCGYTTWYNYYTSVTEQIVERDLNSISSLDTKIDIFQIDDGYERTVGDWLEPDEIKFPSGMKKIADMIHSNDMLAGLWLAPFAVTAKSHIYKNHRDWLVKYSDGKNHITSQNWGGFYTLDIYNEQARDYIKTVFDTVLNKWGYDMVKLDFLYACCLVPIHGKSRGEIMCDAMELLRDCCGDKIILGCGVPLAPAFGKVDFCRIGADVDLSWDKKPFSREDVSTQNTLMNTVFRRHLDGRAFLNDPDVFLLRDNNIKMPLSKRKIIATVNSLCGNLLFVSDDVSRYTDEQKQIFVDTVASEKAKINKAELAKPDILQINYTLNGENKTFKFNIKTGEDICHLKTY